MPLHELGLLAHGPTSRPRLPGRVTGGAFSKHTVLTFWPIACFVAVAYTVSWGWTFPLVALGAVVVKVVGWPSTLPALLGPALAAFVVTAFVSGRVAVRDLLVGMARWRIPWRWWAATLSPLAFLAVALAVAATAGTLPGWILGPRAEAKARRSSGDEKRSQVAASRVSAYGWIMGYGQTRD